MMMQKTKVSGNVSVWFSRFHVCTTSLTETSPHGKPMSCWEGCAAPVTSLQLKWSTIVETKQTVMSWYCARLFVGSMLNLSARQGYSFDAHLYNIKISFLSFLSYFVFLAFHCVFTPAVPYEAALLLLPGMLDSWLHAVPFCFAPDVLSDGLLTFWSKLVKFVLCCIRVTYEGHLIV